MFGLSTLTTSLIGGAILILIGTGAGAYGASIYYGGRIAQMERDTAIADKARATADLKQYTDIATQIQAAARDMLKGSGVLNGQMDTIAKDLENVHSKKPLPRDCKPTVDRVRNLSSAIAAANSAAGF